MITVKPAAWGARERGGEIIEIRVLIEKGPIY
jgi:hypothetical protein